MNSLLRKIEKSIQQIISRLHPLTNQIDSRINRRWVARRSMVSNKWNYCYFRIPKCANSTIVRSLAYYDPSIIYNSFDSQNDPRGKGIKKKTARLLSANALTVSQLAQKYFLFTFVRNPYSKVLSAYLDKVARLEKKSFESTRKIVRDISNKGHDLNFGMFIAYLEKRGLYEDPHWAPQIAMLPISVTKINFVGKVENLEKDLEYVINHIFGEGVYKNPQTRQDGRTDSANNILQYYTGDLFDRVHKLYKSDFDFFSYPKDWSRQITI